MAKDDGKSPFAMRFMERNQRFYDITPEQRRVEKSLTDLVAALDGDGKKQPVASAHRSAVHAFYDEVTRDEALLAFGGNVLAEALAAPELDRAHRSLLLTLVARASLEDMRPGESVRERQLSQMARLIAGAASILPSEEMRVFVEWAADMATGHKGSYEPQPVSVIRGILFARPMVKAFDIDKAKAFWTQAIAEPKFPWHIFSEPCRADRGGTLTEFHVATIVMILGIAPEPAVRRIVTQMAENFTTRRVEAQGRDARGGKCLVDETEPFPIEERRRMFVGIARSVTDAHHAGRRTLVSDLFGAV